MTNQTFVDTLGSYLNRPISDSATSSAAEIREEMGLVFDKMQAICNGAKDANRDLSRDESERLEFLRREIDKKHSALNVADGSEKKSLNDAIQFLAGERGYTSPATTHEEWRDSDGKPVHVMSKGQRWQDLPHLQKSEFKPGELRIGRHIQAAITGDWKRAPAELRNAMSTGSNPAGGFAVPEELAAQLIDKARAKMVMAQAGARFVPMSTDHMTIARINTDPAIEAKAENDSFTAREVGLGSVGLTAYTIGTMVTASRELAEDAPNFVEMIENVIANALATAVDNYAFNGSGSQEPLGLLLQTGIGSTGSVGAIAWEDLNTAVIDVMSNNGEPNAYVVSPTIAGDLAILASGDAVNSAKMWLGPPPTVSPLQQLVTSNIADSDILVGDFNGVIIGLRQAAQIEVTREGDNAFSKHQVLIKIVFRGDFNVEHVSHLHNLTGITT